MNMTERSTHDELTSPQPPSGFAQTFGLHPAIGIAVVAVDSMLFCGDIATAGFLIPLAVVVAVGLGFVTFMAQKKLYGDDDETALIKAVLVFGLSAIPTSLPGFLCAPAGIVGLFGGKEH